MCAGVGREADCSSCIGIEGRQLWKSNSSAEREVYRIYLREERAGAVYPRQRE